MQSKLKQTTGVVHIGGEESSSQVEKVRALLGYKISDVCGKHDKLFAYGEDGIFDILSAYRNNSDVKLVPIADIPTSQLVVGKDFLVSLSFPGDVYTWGSGFSGELGHGIRNTSIPYPTMLTIPGKVVQISSGESHTCAVDSKGNAYAWGQNFDRQLGLYRKDINHMRPGAMIEGVMMVPKFCAFTMKNPISYIACGARFTVAISKVRNGRIPHAFKISPSMFLERGIMDMGSWGMRTTGNRTMHPKVI